MQEMCCLQHYWRETLIYLSNSNMCQHTNISEGTTKNGLAALPASHSDLQVLAQPVHKLSLQFK